MFSGRNRERQLDVESGPSAWEPNARISPRIFAFIIRALPPTGALSHAIFVSDFQDICYSNLCFQKNRDHGRKRGGHALRDDSCEAGAGSVLVKPPNGETPYFFASPLVKIGTHPTFSGWSENEGAPGALGGEAKDEEKNSYLESL